MAKLRSMVAPPLSLEPRGDHSGDEPSGAPPLVPGPEDSPIAAVTAPLAPELVDTLPRQWFALLRAHGPIAALVVIGAALRGFALSESKGSLIGDEAYYVQSARVIVGLPVLATHLHMAVARSFVDPNREHPPLAKVIMAEMIRLMGNREVAFRLPSVILGTLTIWLIYAIVLKLRGTRSQALLAACVLTFENLCLVHGRIATLDIYFVAFILVGTLLYLSSYLEVAALAFAIATLCKTNAILGLFAVLLYDAFMGRSYWRTPVWPTVGRRVLVVGLYLGFFLIGLGTLDCFFTEFTGPIAHLKHMASFHAGLKSQGSSGTHSTPFLWWNDEGTFNYLSVRSTRHGVVTKRLLFQAVMTGYVIFLAPLGLLYAAMKAWTLRSPLATFALASFLGNFVPIFMAWAVMSRTSYIYYMLPIIPSFALAFAFASGAVPTKVRWGFVAVMLYACALQYPIRVL